MKLKTHLLTLGLIALTGFFSTAAHAHHVWLNATRYTVTEPGKTPAKSTLTFGWGDFFPLHDFLKPEQVKRLWLRSPQGQEQTLQPGVGGFQATAIELPSTGTYIAATELAPRFLTQIKQNNETKWLYEPKTAVPAGAEILQSKQSLYFAKAILNVGAASQTVPPALGNGLELVPLMHPAQLQAGDELPLQVHFNGQPLRPPAAIELEATYLGFSTNGEVAWRGKLNNDGTVRLKLQRHGIWQVYARYVKPAPSEMASQVNTMDYQATLTFEIKPQK